MWICDWRMYDALRDEVLHSIAVARQQQRPPPVLAADFFDMPLADVVFATAPMVENSAVVVGRSVRSRQTAAHRANYATKLRSAKSTGQAPRLTVGEYRGVVITYSQLIVSCITSVTVCPNAVWLVNLWSFRSLR